MAHVRLIVMVCCIFLLLANLRAIPLAAEDAGIDYEVTIDEDGNVSIQCFTEETPRPFILQRGRLNFLFQLRTGLCNRARILQYGRLNRIVQIQRGQSNRVHIVQEGERNTARVEQEGASNTAVIIQGN